MYFSILIFDAIMRLTAVKNEKALLVQTFEEQVDGIALDPGQMRSCYEDFSKMYIGCIHVRS